MGFGLDLIFGFKDFLVSVFLLLILLSVAWGIDLPRILLRLRVLPKLCKNYHDLPLD